MVESAGDVTVHGDRLLLRQALINLLDNAIKYSPPGATIRMRLGDGGPDVRVEVIDAGPGVPPVADRV